jgi:hypothetical protein
MLRYSTGDYTKLAGLLLVPVMENWWTRKVGATLKIQYVPKVTQDQVAIGTGTALDIINTSSICANS